MRCIKLIFCSAVLLAAGCASQPATEPEERAVLPPEQTGIWTVVAHHAPGVSAMSDTEASAWHGLSVRLEADAAFVPDAHCAAPTYTARTVEADHFLATEYRIRSEQLGALRGSEQITVLELACDGAPWSAPGGRLLMTSNADRVWMPWDGVFFELERDHDFRATGNEPFWMLEIRKGKALMYRRLGFEDVLLPIPTPKRDPAGGSQIWHVRTETHDLHAVIEGRPCMDTMSGEMFEATVTVVLNEETLHACGRKIRP